MSLEIMWGEERKCSVTVVGLDLVLKLSKVRWCSFEIMTKTPHEYIRVTYE